MFFNDETISYPVYNSCAASDRRCLQLPTRVSFVWGCTVGMGPALRDWEMVARTESLLIRTLG